MASASDQMNVPQTWIHELAKAEVHPEAEKLLQLGGFNPQQLVEESTVRFLDEMRRHINEYARVFNGFSGGGSKYQEVKLYSIALSAADFMVFRNQIKLVVANTGHGVIQLSFSEHARPSVMVDGQSSAANKSTIAEKSPAQELLAQIGPFRDVAWTFQGERISPEQVARFYFAEFVRASRDMRVSKMGNQLLIRQIEALLLEKASIFKPPNCGHRSRLPVFPVIHYPPPIRQ